MDKTFIDLTVQNFFAIFVVLIFFIVFTIKNKHFNHEIRTLFYYILASIMLLAFSDIFQGYFESLSYPTWQRKLFACISYCARPLIIYVFGLTFIRPFKKKTNILLAIPLLVNAAIVFSSFIFKEAVFYYTEDNQIVRQGLILSPFITSLFYIVMLLAFGRKRVKNHEYLEFTLLISIVALCLVATVLEMYLRYQGLICDVAIIGLVFYYLYFTVHSYSFDELTGALLRKKLYSTLENNKGLYALISLDFNDLKKVNDQFGHQAGDKALVDFVKMVREILPTNSEIYRMGGDEFIILYHTTDENDVKQLIDKIQNGVKKLKFSVAIGYAMKNIFKSFEQAFEEADKEMYISKNNYKKNHEEKGID